tara:strand:- start:244 stop:612 length:369 start_codon:yes stop_codon:yes gene_type:complete
MRPKADGGIGHFYDLYSDLEQEELLNERRTAFLLSMGYEAEERSAVSLVRECAEHGAAAPTREEEAELFAEARDAEKKSLRDSCLRKHMALLRAAEQERNAERKRKAADAHPLFKSRAKQRR